MTASPAGNPARLSPPLAGLFPDGVVAAELRTAVDVSLLLPEEHEYVARSAERRVRDFAGGRLCARRALAELDIHDFPLRAAEDRRALWPDGVVGSITHTREFCAAVVARQGSLRSLGIDAEVRDRVTAPMRGMICTEAEQVWIGTLPEAAQNLVSALAFSCKEAFYKCQYELSRQWLDFKDVSLVPEQTDLRDGLYTLRLHKPVAALASIGPLFSGRFIIEGPLIISAMAFKAGT